MTDVALRIIESDGATEVIDFNDRASGYSLYAPPSVPEEPERRGRYESPRAIGDFTQGPPRAGAGVLGVPLKIEGTTWDQVETRYEAVRTAVKAEWAYFIELDQQGVARRWRTDPPSIEVVEQNLVLNRMKVSLRFICQPNPTVSV